MSSDSEDLPLPMSAVVEQLLPYFFAQPLSTLETHQQTLQTRLQKARDCLVAIEDERQLMHDMLPIIRAAADIVDTEGRYSLYLIYVTGIALLGGILIPSVPLLPVMVGTAIVFVAGVQKLNHYVAAQHQQLNKRVSALIQPLLQKKSE